MTITVLVADDQEMVRSGFAMILGSQPDIEVIAQCADGVQAIEAARRWKPDVVVVDIRMPKLDGLAVTRALAGAETSTPMNVVVVTTFDDDDYVDAALDNGALGFLLKNSGANLLVEAVRAASRGDALISPELTVRLLRRRRATGTLVREGEPVAHQLSQRELEVVQLVAQGSTNDDIGATLFISLSTVKSHLTSIHSKLGLTNRVQVAAWAWRNGLVPAES